jgi:hypothetical protein
VARSLSDSVRASARNLSRMAGGIHIPVPTVGQV